MDNEQACPSPFLSGFRLAFLLILSALWAGPATGQDAAALADRFCQTSGTEGNDAARAARRADEKQALTPLMGTLKRDTDPAMRAQAARALGCIGSEQAVDPLVEALASSNTNPVREQAAKALGRIGDSEATAPLSRILLSDATNDAVRAAAAQALGSIGDAQAREPLAQQLSQEDNPQVRTAIMDALARLD